MYDLSRRGDAVSVNIGITLDLRIPLRDGVTLSGNLYRSGDGTEPLPTILILTPYTSQFHHEAAMFFAAHGFHFLSVDIRGRGNSDGALSIGSEDRDGADVVEWVAAQDFCNGKIAMWGGSYAGYAQWRTAQSRPKGLTTVMPVAAPWRGLDSPMRNNIFSCDRIQWLALIHGRTAQERIFADEALWIRFYRTWFEEGRRFRDLDQNLGSTNAHFQEWLEHPTLDRYWQDLNPSDADYAEIQIPVLSITGYFDADQPGAIEHYRRHISHAPPEAAARHYLIIGPWDHGGTRRPSSTVGGVALGAPSVIDMAALDLAWYRWTLCDGPRPTFLKKRVAYYVMGAEKWRYADSLEEIKRGELQLFLGCGGDTGGKGTLSRENAVCTGTSSYVYDPADRSLAALEASLDRVSLVDRSMAEARIGREIVFETQALDGPLEISGWFRLELWLAIDQPDTDFCVRIFELDQNGGSLLLSSDIQRARHREGLTTSKLIAGPTPLLYTFERFTFISRLVPAGHRLRLTVGPIDSIYLQKNYNSGRDVSDETLRDACAVTVTIHHGPSFPSALAVPLGGTSAKEQAAFA